jgi:PTS system nitrogen regulatory IIA component
MPANPENRFSDFLRPANIRCPLNARDWKSAITELIQLLHQNEDRFSPDDVLAACIQRERSYSTVVASHIALPHVRVENLDRVLVAVGLAPHGIEFPARERGEVKIIVVILSPKNVPDLYLQALAALTRDLHEPAARERLAACATPREVYTFFNEISGDLPPFLTARHLMIGQPVTVLESDTLHTVIEVLCMQGLLEVPVVDDEGDLRGVVSHEDVLRMSLPEHLLWMHDLSTILRFKPFADVLRRDKESKVADFMRDKAVTVAPDMPAIQVAKLFLTENVRQILVVDGRALLGVIKLEDFMAKLFWA